MNLYEVLGVSRNSEPEVIDAAYRALMKKYHPDTRVGDKSEAELRSKGINEAYRVLKDVKRRREYDEALEHKQLRDGTRTTPKNLLDEKLGAPSALMIGALVLSMVLMIGWGASKQGWGGGSAGPASALAASSRSAVPTTGMPQHFCITNKTAQAVKYAVSWGSKPPNQLGLWPGDYHLHESTRGFGATIRWRSGSEAEELVIDAGDMPVSSGACLANYEFAYIDTPVPGYTHSPGDPFGLYRRAW